MLIIIRKIQKDGNAKPETLKDGPLAITDGATLVYKDLGPQIAWRTVFIVEYFVPMIAFPLIYLLRSTLYGQDKVEQNPLTRTQWIAFLCFVAHFAKRELETIFVHKFSKGTMPIFNLFKNSGYYWGFAFLVAYFVLSPTSAARDATMETVGLVLFIVCYKLLSYFAR